jgi:hypothetical protein
MLPSAIRVLGKIWLYGVSILILLSYVFIWYQRRFSALQDMLSPYNFTNFIAVAITLAPGYFLHKLAGEIEEKQRGKALWSFGAVILSVAGVVLMVMLVVVGQDSEIRKANGNEQTREYRATSIRVKGKSATMYQHKNYLLTQGSGPVGSEGIPDTIQIGDMVTIGGNTIQVQHIIVTEFLSDMKYGGETLGMKGDIHCTIVQSLDSLPYVEEHKFRDRLWINVKDCDPLKLAVLDYPKRAV